MKSRLVAIALGATVAFGGAQASNATREWRFDVLLNDRLIGSHSFRLTERRAHREVFSEARFRVKVLFITAYRYTHIARETWRDNCLTAIDAATDDNGDVTTLRGEALVAQRYCVFANASVGGPFRIDLWCSMDGRWLGLESTTQDGRLSYRLR